ncbi:MAG: hypothetical protein ACTHQM_08630 [Thermoanaerobaculia bacterium]
MKLRIVLICTLLLMAAAPSFAAPQCEACDYYWNECYNEPYSGFRCRYTETGCEEYYGYCIGRAPQASVMAEWKVASIEVTRPTLDSKSVTTTAQVAEVRTPQTVAQK